MGLSNRPVCYVCEKVGQTARLKSSSLLALGENWFGGLRSLSQLLLLASVKGDVILESAAATVPPLLL